MILRTARPGDCAFVWDVNFAPDVRAVSGSTASVTYASHASWFAQRLDRPAFWIVETEPSPAAVGTVRIDVTDGAPCGVISIALRADVRGRGVGRTAIREACRRFGGRVVAKIHIDNRASRAAFEACGFTEVLGDEPAGDLVTYAWAPGEH